MTRTAPIDLDAASILFEDEDLVAVDKASGWLSDATRDPQRDHLGAALSRRAEAAGEGGGPFLPAHRLDRATSGVVLFARNRAAASSLMRQFQARTVAKAYRAIVGHPRGAEWQIGTTFERRSHLRHRAGRTEEVRTGGKVAETRFEVVDLSTSLALVRAVPRTGRTHQLRVHFAALGVPILGDDLYGGSLHDDPARLWLHADSLHVVHPRTERSVCLRSRRTLVLADGAPAEVAAPSSG